MRTSLISCSTRSRTVMTSVDSIPSSQLHPGNLHIQQGAAARQTAMFVVDKTYTPVKLLVQCATCSPGLKFRNLRLTIPPPPSTGQ